MSFASGVMRTVWVAGRREAASGALTEALRLYSRKGALARSGRLRDIVETLARGEPPKDAQLARIRGSRTA